MKASIFNIFALLVSLSFLPAAHAGEVDVHFAGATDNLPQVVSGEISSAGNDKVEFRGNDAEQADAAFASIVGVIQGSLSPTFAAQLVVHEGTIQRVEEVEFSTLTYNGVVYLFAELADGSDLIWTSTAKD